MSWSVRFTPSLTAPTGGGSVPPGWATQTDNTWVAVNNNTPNSIKPTLDRSGGAWDSTNFGNIMSRWSGGAFDAALLRHYFVGGGHGDYSGNEHFMFDHLNAGQAFQLLRNPSVAAGGDQSESGSANYGDGQPRSCHTYNSLYFAGGRLWSLTQGAMASAGNFSTKIFSWAHGEADWTDHGKGIATPPGGSWTYLEGAAAYDSARGKLYLAAPVASSGKSYYSILATSPFTKTEFDQHFDMGQYCWMTYLPTPDIIVAGSTFAGNFWYMDCSNPAGGFNGLNYSGTPKMLLDLGSGGGHYAGHYHAGHNRIYGWEAVDGKNMSYLQVPGNPISGTYTGGTLTSDASSATPATTTGTVNGSDGVFGKFQIFQAADGRYGASLALNTNGSLWRYKFSVAAA